MSISKSIQLIQRIDFLVRTRSTGSARDLGYILGVSQRSVYYYLEELKDLGAPLSWSVHDYSYVYPEGYRIIINFSTSLTDR